VRCPCDSKCPKKTRSERLRPGMHYRNEVQSVRGLASGWASGSSYDGKQKRVWGVQCSTSVQNESTGTKRRRARKITCRSAISTSKSSHELGQHPCAGTQECQGIR